MSDKEETSVDLIQNNSFSENRIKDEKLLTKLKYNVTL